MTQPPAELKRSLGLLDLLAYGLVFITPLAPVSVFGIVFNASRGMVPLVYVIGLVAMVFTALGYTSLSRAFPVAGSVYAYARESLGAAAGFFTGWAIMLDYVLIPTLSYVVSAIAIESVFPEVSKPLCVAVMVAIATGVNYLGIETTARASFALLAIQLALLAAFGAAAALALAHHVARARLDLTPFWNPALVTPALLLGALSIAVLSFLGFDAISTLAEESRDGARSIGRATLLSLAISALLFVVQTWIASLFLPGLTRLAPGDATNAAFYDVAERVGGPVLKFAFAVPGVFLASLAGAITAQAATARLLFAMARDGDLPSALAYVDPVRQVPTRTTLLVSVVTLAAGFTLVDRLELLTSMVSFGALLGFSMLQISVVVHFIVRQRSRRYARYLVVPAIGLGIVALVLWNAETNAKIAGAWWMAAGGASFAVKRWRARA